MKPTAAPPHFPYDHRSMAEIMRDEQIERFQQMRKRVRDQQLGRGRTA